MNWKKIVVIAISLILLPIVFGNEKSKIELNGNVAERGDAIPVIVSKENPFYAIIATPISLYYDDNGMHVKPLLVENFSNPSKSIERFLEYYDMKNAIKISNEDIEKASIELSKIWNKSNEAMVVENSYEGYKMAVSIASLASYEDMPIFITNNIENIRKELDRLNVKKIYIIGNLSNGGYDFIKFNDMEEIINFMINYLKNKFDKINYIVMINPRDIKKPEVLDSIEYKFINKTNSVAILPAQSFHALVTGQFIREHKFEIPSSYKHARIKIDLINLDSQYAKELGDEIFLMITRHGKIYVYTATGAGLPEYKNNDIIKDEVHYEFIVSNESGEYTARVIGRWFADVEGRYELKIRVESIDNAIDPGMHGLSSMASYLAAYHKGIVYANDFSFASNNGMSEPSDNPNAIEPCNEHIISIHKKLNKLLSKISGKEGHELWEYYKNNPIYIAIMADATMIPMFYYKNPDSDYLLGWGVPSDFIYGDIDVNLNDTENDTYTYYPKMENAVGRVTGYDAEDCSALIARTIFYNEIIEKLGDWKNNATVQTGSGLEFQWVPILTTISNMISGQEEPTKWPSGESYFANLHLSHDLEEAGFNVHRTMLTSSQREGFKNLSKYGRKYILFPHFIEAISGENVKGGEYKKNSNIIFAFDHGFYYLYEAGDILLNARGFPPFTTISRFYYMGSGLSSMGSYDVSKFNFHVDPSFNFNRVLND